MTGKRKGFGRLCKIAAILTVIGLAWDSALSFALIDETNSVHIDASEIENATLIIGSHLIYLDSMNDQIYEKAMESAKEANQYKRYYKSELAGGSWYDITDAGALSDITTGGIVVEDKVIEELFMTHHTKSDGITYDLKNGNAVSIFNINDPYNLENLSELEPIKLQYNVLVQTEDPSDTMERDIHYIEEIYKYDRQTEKTRKLDQQIEALQKYYEILARDEADSAMSDIVLLAMEKLDSARRVEVLASLSDYQLQKMSQVVGREFAYLEGEITGSATETAQKEEEEAESGRDVIENFVANTDLITAIGEAMANVQESYSNYSSKMLAEGTTAISKAEYNYYSALIASALGDNYAACDRAVKKLIYLDRMNNSIIHEAEEEKDFIALELLEEAGKQYQDSLGEGVGPSYQTLSTMAAEATRKNVLKNQLSQTEIIRNELQFIMQAYMDRMAPEAAKEYITGCIDRIGDYRSVVKADAFETFANTSIDSHLEWMTKTVKNLQAQLGGSELDELHRKKEDLQTKHMTALDRNRLEEAKKLQAQMEALDKEMEEIKAKLNSILISESASESEKAMALAQLGSGNANAVIEDLKSKAIEEIKDGKLEEVSSLVDGIGALAQEQSGQAKDALKDLYQELLKQELMGADSENLNDLLSRLEEVMEETTKHSFANLSESMLAALIREYVQENMTDSEVNSLPDNLESPDAINGNINDVMDSLTTEQIGTILVGLNRYGVQTGSSMVQNMVSIYGKQALDQGNPYIYEQLRDESFEFIPTDKLSVVTGYRYIFNDSQKSVTLQKRDVYYQFTAFSQNVKKSSETLEMLHSAGFQSVIYIPEDTAFAYFKVDAEYLTKTSCGVIVTEQMSELADLLVEYLLESGEEI